MNIVSEATIEDLDTLNDRGEVEDNRGTTTDVRVEDMVVSVLVEEEPTVNKDHHVVIEGPVVDVDIGTQGGPRDEVNDSSSVSIVKTEDEDMYSVTGDKEKTLGKSSIKGPSVGGEVTNI